MEDFVPDKYICYAHSNSNEKSGWQPLEVHLRNSAKIAFRLGLNAGISELSYTAALLHDIGKFSQEFQERLQDSKKRVDHSSAGAIELIKLYKHTYQEPLALMLAYCITGHHTGMPDYGSITDLSGEGTLMARLKAQVPDYSRYKTEIAPELIKLPKHLNLIPISNNWGFSLSFLVRMVYSTLVDADYLDTESFLEVEKPRGEYEDIPSLCARYNTYLSRFANPQREIDRMRNLTLQDCLSKAEYDKGYFSLTIPTGGGKTLSSMTFALNHAVRHGLKRIIYVIPFTSIIEQNAAVFKEILGSENILEHHSNFDWEKNINDDLLTTDNQTNSANSKLKLAAENWDIPIVVTTNVQFFESIFSNRSSRARKLHNLAKSVIIFDEAQMLPKEYLLPCMFAVRELVINYGATTVFCTATQPELEKFLPDCQTITEIASEPTKLFNYYKRVEVRYLGKMTDDELLEQLNKHEQALCIVNTRTHARCLYEGMPGENNYHLSALMCAVHRKQVIEEIRQCLVLKNPCRVISTTVLEAGVDLDFPVGFRALTGLDSINQAAGRVNREMRIKTGILFVFEEDTSAVKRQPDFVMQSALVTREVMQDHLNELISVEAIHAYFERLYNLRNRSDFDSLNILSCFNKSQPYIFDFATAAKNFQIIKNKSITIIIPYDEKARKYIEELKVSPRPGGILRKLQPYTVSVYEHDLTTLINSGAIWMVEGKYAILNNMNYYHPQTGLSVSANSSETALFF